MLTTVSLRCLSSSCLNLAALSRFSLITSSFSLIFLYSSALKSAILCASYLSFFLVSLIRFKVSLSSIFYSISRLIFMVSERSICFLSLILEILSYFCFSLSAYSNFFSILFDSYYLCFLSAYYREMIDFDLWLLVKLCLFSCYIIN